MKSAMPESRGQAVNQSLVPRLGTRQAQRAVFIVAQAAGLVISCIVRTSKNRELLIWSAVAESEASLRA
jgi:hypothetical protein